MRIKYLTCVIRNIKKVYDASSYYFCHKHQCSRGDRLIMTSFLRATTIYRVDLLPNRGAKTRSKKFKSSATADIAVVAHAPL